MYHAETAALATYRNVLKTIGSARQFQNIADAEQQHTDTLTKLAAAHGVALPAAATGEASPATLHLACALGVRLEQGLIAQYDQHLPALGPYPDLQRAFQTMREASATHLAAFQRCA